MKSSEIYSNYCCGCGACALVCKQNAIRLIENQKGFLIPSINEDKCIDCNLCKTVCNTEINLNPNIETYILKSKDKETQRNSQSGGGFSILSNYFLNNGGIVYGVIYDEDFEGVYCRAENKNERNKMRGSKYIQSKTKNIFEKVKTDLNNKKNVLFSGTPCVVAGLLKYLNLLKVNTENLFTIDLLCHGTPSVLIWRDMKQLIQKKYGTIKNAVFRDERIHDWPSNKSSFECKKIISNKNFLKLFFTNLCLNDSCYKCLYTKTSRIGDITLGDAHGVIKNDKEFYDVNGVSLILINSEKGKKIFEITKNQTTYKRVNINNYIQQSLSHPVKANRSIDEFWLDYKTRNFYYIINKYSRNNIFLNYKYIVKKFLNKIGLH